MKFLWKKYLEAANEVEENYQGEWHMRFTTYRASDETENSESF